jgi:hypothetical protein
MIEFLKLRAEYLFHSYAGSNVAARGLKLMPLLNMQNTVFLIGNFSILFKDLFPKRMTIVTDIYVQMTIVTDIYVQTVHPFRICYSQVY